jgi:murein DD-endopeptidase MepM/ murein hydrolase activator NlpD
MKRAIILLLALAGLFPLTLTAAHPLQSEPTPPPEGNPPFNLEAQVEAAIYQAIESGRQTTGVPSLYTTEVEQVKVSQDAAWASAWLVLTDPKSGEVLPSEPGLALAQREAGGWQVTLPGEPGWETWLEASPTDLLPPAIREEWLQANRDDLATAQTEAIRGFLLPWERGKTVWLSRSVTHVKDYASGYYAWDFYISGQMYNLYASRGGTVWLAYDSVPNNNHDDVNYLVIKDETTTPVSYHLYLHLAQNSIPKALKTIGTPIVQGQFLGIADNTGASTGHHLHFHVFTSPSWKYWGPSVDITFDDVAINGGRPRRTDELDDCKSGDVCVSGANSYVSGNTVRIGPTPPEGDILDPINAVTISTPTVHLEGWASDTDSGLSSAQFMAEWDGIWHPIGSSFSTLQFEMDWDLCSDQVPDGPVSLALKLRDNAGSQSLGLPGLRHFTKNYTCPLIPPVCVPSDNQVALFADPDYHGACTLIANGSYLNAAALGSLGGDNAASIQVGASVQATLYSQDSKTGRSETFSGSDSNLADNRIGANTVSSALVQARPTAQAQFEAGVQEDIGPDATLDAFSPTAPEAPPVPFFADMESASQPGLNSLWRTTTDNNHTRIKPRAGGTARTAITITASAIPAA